MKGIYKIIGDNNIELTVENYIQNNDYFYVTNILNYLKFNNYIK